MACPCNVDLPWREQRMYFVRELSMDVAVYQPEVCRICGKEDEGWRIIPHPQELADAFEHCQSWRVRLWQLLPRYGNSVPFWSDLSLVKVQDSRRSQVPTGVVQGADH